MSAPKKRILHVEDDIAIQQYINTLLSSLAEITSTNKLREAQELIKKNQYDMIIIDFTLPDGSGSELVSQLAKHSPAIPVIIFSSHEIANTLTNVKHRFHKTHFTDTILIETVSKYLSA